MKIGKMQARLKRRQDDLEKWSPRESKVASRKLAGGYRRPGSPKQSG